MNKKMKHITVNTNSRNVIIKLNHAIELLDPKSVVLINIKKYQLIGGFAIDAFTSCVMHA
jgi:hypothetical protein